MRGTDSYIENKYKSLKPTDFNIHSIQTSIDKMVLTRIKPDFHLLDSRVCNEYAVLRDHWAYKRKYRRIRHYENINDGHRMELIYTSSLSQYKWIPPFTLVVHKPDNQIQEYLVEVFDGLNILPCLSQIELAWDFYVDDPWDFQQFLVACLCLRWQRKNSWKYINTYYTSDLRRSSKGNRVYVKKDEHGNSFVRLELVLNRAALRNLNIDFPLYPFDFDLDYTRFFEFLRLDVNKLRNYLLKQNQKKIHQMNNRKRSHGVHPVRQKAGDILHSQIESYIRTANSGSQMACIEFLSGRSNPDQRYSPIQHYRRFMKSMPELDQLVGVLARSQKFKIKKVGQNIQWIF